MWKIKRAAQQHVNNDKTVRKEVDKKQSYEYHLKRRLVKEFCLFVLIEEPWQSESRVIKNTWEIFRGEIQKAKSTDNVEFIVPFEDAIIREIDIHVESTTLFYFALEKVAGINHVIRHVELDTPYFDVEIQEDFIFSVLSSLNSSFNTMDNIASDIDELGSDSNLQLDIVRDQYLTIQSSLDEAQKEDENHIEYFFEEIVFHPLEVRLTYRGSASGSTKKLSSLNRKSRGLGALSSLPSIDDLVVIFSSLQQSHAANTIPEFTRLVGKFYTDQAMARLYKVVFKISVLDSPVRAVAGIGSGVSQLLQTPGRTLKALAKGDLSGAAKQFGSGLCGLAYAIVGGGAKVAGGAVGGVGFVFKKVTNVSAVTKTLFSPASNLLDLASSNLEGAYDALVEDRLKSSRRNNRVRLPRKPDTMLLEYCYMDAVALHLRRHITNFSMRKDAKVGHLVPAISCIQKGQYVYSCYILHQIILQLDPSKNCFIQKTTEQIHDICLLVLSSLHLFCLESEDDTSSSCNLLWAIPFRRIRDLNVVSVIEKSPNGARPAGTSDLQLVVSYETDDRDSVNNKYDSGRKIFLRQRRIASTNRRNLYSLYLHCENIAFC